MRIGIVTKHLGLPVGFGTYAARLLDAYAADPGGHEFFVYAPRRAAPSADLGGRFTVRTLPVPPGLRSALAVWEHAVVPQVARRDRLDVLHYLHTAAPLRPSGTPVVVNVLDTIAWSLPGYEQPRVYDRLARRAIRSADRVLTISESARGDIAGIFGLAAERIAVTPLAGPRADPEPAAEGDYLLFVGGTERRKNLSTAMQAFAAADLGATRLKVVGPSAASPVNDSAGDVMAPLSDEQRARVDWLGHVDSSTIARLYREAIALVFPSRYEGFGLPVLEAMARHTPVISSNVSSLPEVAGDAALLVDPDDVDALRRAMERVVAEPELRRELVERGLKRAAGYSWKQTARGTLATYEEAAR